jgi:hypothetical protein
MGIYNPAVISRPLAEADTFDGDEINDAFDELGVAINDNVESTNNVTDNSILPWFKFHQQSVCPTWTSGERGLAIFNVILEAPATPQPMFGLKQNVYDVDDTGVDFYLRSGADALWFDGFCNLRNGKDSWNSIPTQLGYDFTLELFVDGVSLRTVRWAYPRHAGVAAFEKRGFPMALNHVETGGAYVAAGKHTAFLRLTCDFDIDPAYGALPRITSFVSLGRGLSVFATYA